MATSAEAKVKSVHLHGNGDQRALNRSGMTWKIRSTGHQVMLGLGRERAGAPSTAALPTAVGLCACCVVRKEGLFQRKREGHCR